MRQRIISLMLMVFAAMTLTAQDAVYTRQYQDKTMQKKARKWLKKQQWRQGFTTAWPHESVNVTEFYEQYEKNPTQWTALFRWLSSTDLLAIPAGRHPIEGTTLVASVEDSQNGPLEKRSSESHYHHIDFQYVVKGVERFGIIDHVTSTPKDKWRDDVIHYHYDAARARFYDSATDQFFIFFPNDWHIAKINNDSDDQDIRVIVIKVDYVE